MKNKAGIIQVLLLLLVLSVIAASSVSIMAQQIKVGRQLKFINSSPRPLPTSTSSVRGPCYPIGDANNDGVIKPDDVTVILNYVAGLKPTVFSPANADVNRDGKITSVDAQLIQQYIAGIIKTFPACS